MDVANKRDGLSKIPFDSSDSYFYQEGQTSTTMYNSFTASIPNFIFSVTAILFSFAIKEDFISLTLQSFAFRVLFLLLILSDFVKCEICRNSYILY